MNKSWIDNIEIHNKVPDTHTDIIKLEEILNMFRIAFTRTKYRLNYCLDDYGRTYGFVVINNSTGMTSSVSIEKQQTSHTIADIIRKIKLVVG